MIKYESENVASQAWTHAAAGLENSNIEYKTFIKSNQ